MQKLFADALNAGSWLKVFVHCLWRPCNALSNMIKDEILWTLLVKHRNRKLKKNQVAVKYIQRRIHALLMADMVSVLRNNSWFLSVTNKMIKWSPKLHKLLTETCAEPVRDDLNYEDFRVNQVGLRRVATNIGPLVALLVYLYKTDRKHLTASIDDNKITSIFSTFFHGRPLKDYIGDLNEDNNNDDLDEGDKWFHVVNPLRKQLLKVPVADKAAKKASKPKGKKSKKKQSEEEPEEEPDVNSAVSKDALGVSIAEDWRELQLKFYLDGMPSDEAVPFFEFLVMITHGGFISMEEESTNFDFFYRNDSDKLPKISENRKKTPLYRRVEATIKFWTDVEECLFWKKSVSEKKDDLPPLNLIVACEKILKGTFQFQKEHWELQTAEEKKASGKDNKYNGIFPGKTLPDGRKATTPQEIEKLAIDLGLAYNRACLHTAVAVQCQNSDMVKYNYKEDYKNITTTRWNCEGELLCIVGPQEARSKIAAYQSLVKEELGNLKLEKMNVFQMNESLPKKEKLKWKNPTMAGK